MSCTLTHTYVRAQSIWKDNFDLLMVNFCYFWYFSYLKFHNTSTHSIANRSTDLYSDFDWIEYTCVCMCERVLKRPRWLFFFIRINTNQFISFHKQFGYRCVYFSSHFEVNERNIISFRWKDELTTKNHWIVFLEKKKTTTNDEEWNMCYCWGHVPSSQRKYALKWMCMFAWFIIFFLSSFHDFVCHSRYSTAASLNRLWLCLSVRVRYEIYIKFTEWQ